MIYIYIYSMLDVCVCVFVSVWCTWKCVLCIYIHNKLWQIINGETETMATKNRNVNFNENLNGEQQRRKMRRLWCLILVLLAVLLLLVFCHCCCCCCLRTLAVRNHFGLAYAAASDTAAAAPQIAAHRYCAIAPNCRNASGAVADTATVAA